MENVFIMDHPLIQHKISMLRNKNTGTNEFRKLIEEIAVLMGYEALRDLPLEDVEIETPIEKCKSPMIAGKKLAVVPGTSCRTWYGKRYHNAGSVCKDRSYRPLQRSGDT